MELGRIKTSKVQLSFGVPFPPKSIDKKLCFRRLSTQIVSPLGSSGISSMVGW
jgi:hypothetical protein